MPDQIKFSDDIIRPVATADELMAFCNKVREAGGANVIDAFFPAYPEDAGACLIAQSLNFDCVVACINPDHTEAWGKILGPEYPVRYELRPGEGVRGYKYLRYPDGSSVHALDNVWIMKVQHGDDTESAAKAEEIAKKLDLPYYRNQIFLPREIANAAKAFDAGLAFREYNINLLDDGEDYGH